MKYLLMLLLSGCAAQPYWEKTEAQFPHGVFVVSVDFPCAKHSQTETINGCWNAAGRTIEVRKGLTADQRECAVRHEYAHMMGWTHPLNMAYAMDCGPGKI